MYREEQTSDNSLKTTLPKPLLVFLCYTLLTLAMTWPVVARLNTHLVGFGDDMWVHYWNGWWVKRVLTKGGDVYSTRLLFHPQRTSLVYHNFGWGNIAGWLALEPLVGGIAAYNLVYLVNVTLCAFAMFLLARYLIRSAGAAFVAGLVYAYWPYRLSDYGHPNMVSTEWLPLALLSVILLVREGGRVRHALLTGLFLALTSLSRWQMLVPAGIAVGAYLLFSLFTERERWSRRTVGMLLLAAEVTLLLIAVPICPLARDLAMGETDARLYPNEAAGTQTDLLSYLVPPINHPLAPFFNGLEYTSWRIDRTLDTPKRIPYSAFLGYAVLTLAATACLRRWRESRLWVALALVAFLLALGPVLRFNRHFYPHVPMPYRLVGWSPPLRIMRNPHRFNILLALPVAMLAGHGAVALRNRLAQLRPVLLWGLLSALVLFDYFNLPAATVSAHVPGFYASIASEEGAEDFAIVGLPGDRQSSEYYMFYQTVHERPLLDGHISRLPPNALRFISSVPLVDGIYQSGTINTDLPDLSRQLASLAEAGFRYIILHKNLASPEQSSEWRSYLLVPPRYEDDEVAVYSTTPVVGEDCSLKYNLGPGIGLIEATLSKETVGPQALLELQAVWGTTAPPMADLQIKLALVDEAGNENQPQRFTISPDWPTGEWPANVILRDRYSLRVEPWLRGGKHKLIAELVRAKDAEPMSDPVVVGEVTMQAPDRRFTVPPVDNEAETTFGDELRLLGYDLTIERDAAHVTLHWRALRRMDTSYKFFIHLYEEDSEALVAQADVKPHNWTYPTTWWEAQEVVSDEVRLPLSEVSPGRYRLAVGVYDPQTGKRLIVRGSEGLDFLVLQEVRLP